MTGWGEGGELRESRQGFDFETELMVELTITGTDQGGLASSRIVTLNVSNVNEAPSIARRAPVIERGTSVASDIGIVIIATDLMKATVTLKVSDDGSRSLTAAGGRG